MLCHLALASDWAVAQREGRYVMSTRERTIAEVGFMHASDSLEQAARVALYLYADVTESLVLLSLDRELLTAAGLDVRCEHMHPGDLTSEKFPHIYGGTLPTCAVIQTQTFATVDDLVRAAGLSMPVRL